MSRLKCVIFDLGNTLFEDGKSVQHSSEVRYQKLRDLGYEVSREDYNQAIRTISPRFEEKYAGDYRRLEYGPFMEMVFEELGIDYNEEDAKKLDKIFWKERVKNRITKEGANEIIDCCLRKDIDVGIISNANQLLLESALEKLEVDKEKFVEVIYSTDVEAEKSTLEPFRIFLDSTGFNPEECLMVGDRRDEDMMAKELGMKTVLIENGREEISEGMEPDHKIKSLDQLKKIVDQYC